MIVPFIMSLLTIYERPYLWFFYKMLDMNKRRNWPIIAQEDYFVKPSLLVNKHKNLILNKEFVDKTCCYDLPVDEDLDKIQKYVIPKSLEEDLVKETKSYNNAMAHALTKEWPALENLLDEYFTDIEKNNDEKIDAVIALCTYPALYSAAKKHNIKVINFEQGMFREPAYLKTAYFAFSELYDNSDEVEKRYTDFGSVCDNIPLLSRQEILALILNKNYLYYLTEFEHEPQYDMGVCLGYATWMHHLSKTYLNDEELLFRTSRIYDDNFIARMHPGDPAKAQYPKFIKTPDNSPNTIEFILKCKRIVSLGSNVSLESAYWNRSPFTLLPCSTYYGVKHELEDTEEYSVDIKYLNFFAFCYLVPYSLVTDIDYIEWRLTNPSEDEIFIRHIKEYFNIKEISFDEFIECKPEKRLDFLVNAQGYDLYDGSLVSPVKDIALNTAPSDGMLRNSIRTLIAENNVLKSEIEEHVKIEAAYENKIISLKKRKPKVEKVVVTDKTAVKEINKKYIRYKNMYDEVINSTSWKITKPLRVIAGFFRKLFGRK